MKSRNSFGRTCAGILFIIAGVGYIGNLFEIWSFSILFPGWWTLFIIIPSLSSIYENGWRVGNVTFLIFGCSLLLGEWNILHSKDVIQFGVPAFFIVIGCYLLFYHES